ncbi:hypothetical protein [Aquabacterium sp.]|uniref:hypothetical protein n=1 Tax=Aquabacterium sp. TaxID=1872578 RepID=UPI0019B001A2|nr:hypothetical protein [Aquabacterium sp.]MBC7700552.1 hypothetical protein [Aquabacterium sp.]
MALELGSVLIGGGIGLVGGLGGVILGHLLTGMRDSRNRRINGLQGVALELEKRRRLALDIAQHVNLGLRSRSHDEFLAQAFEIPGWKAATLALQERTWLVGCMAFLPEGIPYFQEIDQQISILMSPTNASSTEYTGPSSAEAIDEFRKNVEAIQQLLIKHLAKLK